MAIQESNYSHINGWGIDADPENEPTYPMKNYTGDDHERLNYERPPQQEGGPEILKSTERPTKSAVYGNSVPPTGLSGMIRRFAFKYSENQYRHWLPLLLADRVNMVEGIVQDLGRGHIPNVFAERGWAAEWKYNRKEMAQKVFITTVITTAIVALLLNKRKAKKLIRINSE